LHVLKRYDNMDYYQKYNPLLLARHLSCACHLNINDLFFLHFARGIAEAKCILVTCVCVSVCVPVCLSLAAFPHNCTDTANVYSAEREMSASACTRSIAGYISSEA